MYVHLHPELFDQPNNFRHLDRIIHFFEDDKHDWIIESEEEIEIIFKSEWYQSNIKRVQSTIYIFIEKAFKNPIYRVKKQKTKQLIRIANQENEHEITLTFAINYLNEPLYILVENKFSDAALLNALFKNFRKGAKKIRQAKENGWIRYFHGGGKDMFLKIIDDEYKKKPLPARLFVLMDSDKKSLDDLSESTKRIKEKCLSYTPPVPYHILHKREIENYLPNEVLYKIPKELHPITDELLSLDKSLQDFYDFKGGINNKARKEGIFSELSNESYNLLKLGYKQQKYNPEKSLYLLFNDECVTRENLMAKCKHQENPNELNDILDKITSLL